MIWLPGDPVKKSRVFPWSRYLNNTTNHRPLAYGDDTRLFPLLDHR
jgi:hypothetical protein